jgi:putative FmdB family regulatory protein
MPTYEYRCKACGKEMETFQKMSDAALKTCPSCGKDELERLISSGNFVLKGGGWGKDLYSAKPGSHRTDNQVGDKMEAQKAEAKKKAAEASAPAAAAASPSKDKPSS